MPKRSRATDAAQRVALREAVRCRAGAVTNAGAWYGPGSAKQREERCIAPGKGKKKGPLGECTSGPSLGRKRPRRAAIARGATALQQYATALHKAQGFSTHFQCKIYMAALQRSNSGSVIFHNISMASTVNVRRARARRDLFSPPREFVIDAIIGKYAITNADSLKKASPRPGWVKKHRTEASCIMSRDRCAARWIGLGKASRHPPPAPSLKEPL